MWKYKFTDRIPCPFEQSGQMVPIELVDRIIGDDCEPGAPIPVGLRNQCRRLIEQPAANLNPVRPARIDLYGFHCKASLIRLPSSSRV